MIETLCLGALAGAALVALMWWCDSSTFRGYLVNKAEPQFRTPVRICRRFFYIVPEREYMALRLRAMQARGYPGDEA